MSINAKLGRVKGILTRLHNYSGSISNSTALEDISVRLEKLEDAWNEFSTIEDTLIDEDSANLTENMRIFEEYETKYFEAKSIFVREMSFRSLNSSSDLHAANTSPSANDTLSLLQQQQVLTNSLLQNSFSYHLPRLQVPSFSGDYKEWHSFKDLFESSIHKNSNLSKAQRFQFLKASLKGAALAVIRHLPVTDSNYDDAWKLLNEKFNKRNHIATSFIKSFLEIPPISQPTFKALRSMCDTCEEAIRGLTALGTDAEGRDIWLIHLLLGKLDADTRTGWARNSIDTEFPTITDLLTFLNKRCSAMETAAIVCKRTTTVKSLFASSYNRITSCPKCKGEHFIYQCPIYKADTPAARKTFAIQNALCFKCLGTSHSAQQCHSKIICNQCNGRHHWLLHGSPIQQQSNKVKGSLPIQRFSDKLQSYSINKKPSANNSQRSTVNLQPTINTINPAFSSLSSMQSQDPANTASTENNGNFTPSNGNSSAFSASVRGSTTSLLPTATVYSLDASNQQRKCRLLLDSGSQVSLITEACVQRLGLRRQQGRLSINGLSSSGIGTTRGKVNLTLSSLWDSTQHLRVTAFILNTLIPSLPTENINILHGKNCENIQLADPFFSKPAPIDIVIGADKIFEVLLPGKLINIPNAPTFQETIFGWVAGGVVSAHDDVMLACFSQVDHDIDKLLRSFWEIEELPTDKAMYTSEELQCEQSFKDTLQCNKWNRYVVELPFKDNITHLDNGLPQALSRLKSMERRFGQNVKLRDAYVTFMREYESLGHMELIISQESESNMTNCFYLPHHAVFKNEKIRVVFDGSSKSSSGLSLNDVLMVGPTIQRDLTSILTSFRKHKYAISADVEKMYRQVLIRNDHQDFQRIVWRENTDQPIKHYRLRTVTYGTSSAPFLATRSLFQIGEEIKSSHPHYARVIQSDFYVDDLLTGANSLEEAEELRDSLIKYLNQHGFILTKWISNSNKLRSVPNENSENKISFSSSDTSSKILGVKWDSIADCFTYEVIPPKVHPKTKRQILSESSRIFDPLGWISPITVSVKILLQKLWLQKFNWDDPLPTEIVSKWFSLRADLQMIEKLRIPRLLFHSTKLVQLHGFSDASEAAYSAVLYCRSIKENGKVAVHIVASKTRVAPLKQLSLPRLELAGAVLLARLLKVVLLDLDLKAPAVFAWTDSTIVLHWLSDVPRRWKSFVGNRTSEILETIPRCAWRHVRSHDNPADLASRGVSPSELTKSELWWLGPEWLHQPPSNWPAEVPDHPSEPANLEERRITICTSIETTDNVFTNLCNRCSSYSRIVHTIAYCLLFIEAIKKEQNIPSSLYLTTPELRQATTRCMKLVQETKFPREISRLTTNKPLPARSSVINLYPFLDKDGLLRVGGRLQHSNLNFNTKHPVILPKDHTLTRLLIRELHYQYLHPGASLLLSILRQRYWVLGARNLVRSINHSCLQCFRHKRNLNHQLMGSLPSARVNASRPFSYVGIDFAGPITISTRSGRGSKTTKAYIALFICMAVKCLHLELVGNLTTEAFVAALRRFTSRRGIPKQIFCDNGTNLVGGKNHLSQLYSLAVNAYKTAIINDFLLQNNIEWKFSPPYAPHFGGIWETNVKSVKWHLKRVLGETILGFEELTTLLCQIEAIINARPLVPASTDPKDYEALTPSHFLIGEAITSIPEPDITNERIPLTNRFKQIQQMVQGFWKRWRSDYLTSLQQRPKWFTQQTTLTVGDLVILHDKGQPPTQWSMGRIVAVHPGADGVIRVVTVRNRSGVVKRSANNVSKLPFIDGVKNTS